VKLAKEHPIDVAHFEIRRLTENMLIVSPKSHPNIARQNTKKD
jgi:hypothetical protein